MLELTVLTWLVILFALVFDLTNGWNDSANAISTVVSTRVLRPWTAVLFGATFNFVGALVSSEVAKTVGRDIADPQFLTKVTYLSAVLIAPAWVTWCTLRGLPISCSHSLMGGLIGAVLATVGPQGLKGAGVRKIVFGVFTSPVAGFVGGLAFVVLISWLCRKWAPHRVTRVFGKLQILTAGAMAFSHGTGDAQKAMGIIAGALVAGTTAQFHIPFWTRIACATMMGVGTAVGGWRVIRTLGMRLAHLKPYQGFAAEAAGATTILVNTLTGVPISTTHSITGAIMGVGAAHGVRAVKWGIGRKILFAWIVTFPVCIGGGALFYTILSRLLRVA